MTVSEKENRRDLKTVKIMVDQIQPGGSVSMPNRKLKQANRLEVSDRTPIPEKKYERDLNTAENHGT